MSAACGTELAAARGGEVQTNQFHSGAGNYLVIDGRRTEIDYVYMHLDEPSPRGVGTRFKTKQEIGVVGDIGVVTGCHLHFELWSGPGWYSGGDPFDPLPLLQRWNAYS